MNDMSGLLAAMMSEGCNRHGGAVGWNPQNAEELRAKYEAYTVEHDMKAGDLIRWKPDLKNKRFPNIGDPAMLVEVLSDCRNTEDAGSPHFMEPLTGRIGLIDDDGEFHTWCVDLHRFEPYTAE